MFASRPARRSTSTPATTSPTRPRQQIGFFRKDFGASLLRSTFHIEGPGYQGTGQERSQAVALICAGSPTSRSCRSTSTSSTPTAQPLLGVERQGIVRDRYTVHVPTSASTSGSPPRSRSASTRSCSAETGRWCSIPRRPRRRRGRRRRPVGVDRRLRHRRGPRGGPGRGRRRAARGRRRGRATSTPTGCRCRLYRPAGARRAAWSSTCTAAASSSTTSTSTTRPPAGWPTGPALAVLSVDYRRPPEHRFPAAPDDVDTVLRWLDRDGAGLGLDGPTYVHGDSAGGNLALVAALRNPGRFARGGADLPVPRPDAPASTSYRTAADGFDPAEAAWYWQQYAATPGRPDRPRPGPAALRPARHPAADPGRRPPSTTRCATRASSSPGCSPRRASRWSARATSARCTASGGTPRSSRPPSR